MCTVALFTIAKNLKQPKCPLAEEWGKKKKQQQQPIVQLWNNAYQ